MKNLQATTILALSLLAGACATDTDLETAEHAIASAPILLPVTGTGQSREVMSSFDPLVVTLHDTFGQPIEGATITFTSPPNGATSTFRWNGQVETDDNGRAEIRPYPNSISGTYTVWAHADGADPMPFVLTNTAASPARMLGILGDHQLSSIGMPFAQPLTIEVQDNYGNVIEGAPVKFIAPMTGPTTRMMNNGDTLTDDQGRAATFATAGDMPGTYTVTAKVPGAPNVTFTLSNMAMDQAATKTSASTIDTSQTLTAAP